MYNGSTKVFNVYIMKVFLTCLLCWSVFQNASWYPCIVQCYPHSISEKIDGFLRNESWGDERYAGRVWNTDKYYRLRYFFWIQTRRAPLFWFLVFNGVCIAGFWWDAAWV